MPDDPRVQQLLDELLDSPATPEEVCGAYPDLLPQVRERWRQMLHAQAELDALFPMALEPGMSLPATPTEGTPLPEIPGYQVDAVLGRGGMGVVFRARHLRLNRVVALKMAISGVYSGPKERTRFQREAEAVAILRHPNVVQIHDVGDSEGRPYFTMEHVEGGSLAQKLAGTPMPAREGAALLATLAGAVQAAHAAGIVHRDLKPANVLLTTDGIPKVSDFGLARRLDGEGGLTRTGAALGTPSYMAPEQALGKADAAGPAADIYALGAILYELLTGRPPFRAETAAETVHQLLSQDPVPPSRLNGKVPRDLETICLKCLCKEPRLRYETAESLADDLDRFSKGEPIAARPEGRLARAARRIRRRPVQSAAIAVATLSTIALIAGAVWTLSEREAAARGERATQRAAEGDLAEMAQFLKTSSWHEASAALERAKGRVGAAAPVELHRRLHQGAQDLKLGIRLDAICLEGSASNRGVFAFERSDKDYEEAFRGAGLGQADDDPEAVATQIADSNIAGALVDALDHWAVRVSEYTPRRQDWLQSVARAAAKRRPDPDPTHWRDRARDPNVWKDPAAFDKLIAETRFAEQSVPLLLTVAQHLRDVPKNPIPFMKHVQAAHPSDFWANSTLGNFLVATHDRTEGIRYLQAALAIRPEAAIARDTLATALFDSGRVEEAIEEYRRAQRFDATPRSHRRLGIALALKGPFDEAIEQCRRALPEFAGDRTLRTMFGTALFNAGGRDEEALREFQAAVDLDPNHADAYIGLRAVCLRLGRMDEALAAWGKALDTRPALEHKYWYGYAEARLFAGNENEYRRARQELLKTFGESTDPYIAERTSRACLLLPASADEMQKAVTLADRAAAADRTKFPPGAFPYFLFVKGLKEYRQGQFPNAIAVLRGEASRASGPGPRLVLAMALHQAGQTADARKTLASAIAGHDWRLTNVKDHDGCIRHVLRREAEGMILPKSQDFLKGKYEPRDNDERLILLAACQFANRPLASAKLYADAFAADPSLAEDLGAGHRSNAACAAAQTGCGRGADAARNRDTDKEKWRSQAREWLRADMAAWGKTLEGSPAAARETVRQKLTRWQTDADLAGLREPIELSKLAADERIDCLALWSEVKEMVERCGPVR